MLEKANDGSSTRSGNVPGLVQSEKNKLTDLLGHWEEPEWRSTAQKKASIPDVLRFWNALALISNNFPFSVEFGLANKREACLGTDQRLFHQVLPEGETSVEFEEIVASLAVEGGSGEGNLLHPEKAKSLIRVFRPNRDGKSL